jgi:uncharacterized membrane protein YjjP (DUF1212 family)
MLRQHIRNVTTHMKKLSDLLYGKESSDKMELFNKRISELDTKYESELSNESVESKIIVNYSAGNNINSLHFTDEKLNLEIVAEVNRIFKKIFK